MSQRVRTIVFLVIGAVFVLWIGNSMAQRMYFQPRAEKLKSIEEQTGKFQHYKDVNTAARRREIQKYADRTLGATREIADNALRTRLNRITEELGLTGATVGTTSAVARQSPARRLFDRRGLQGEMRERIDFIELEGWVNAEGTIEQAVGLMARLESEPWLKRLDQVKLTEKDGGKRCAVTVRLTTLVLPGMKPNEAIASAPADPSLLARYALLVNENPFALPPPTPAAPIRAADADQPKPKPGFPYEQWSVTGTAFGPDGDEVWLLRSDGQTMRLMVGQSIGEARLLAAEAEYARFELNQQQFLVSIGAPLSDRAPINQ